MSFKFRPAAQDVDALRLQKCPSDRQDVRLVSVSEQVAIKLLAPVEISAFFGERIEPITRPLSWPLLLTKEQLSSYLAMSWSTIAKVCPVAPINVGANLVRYNRLQIDEWVGGLPPRSTKAGPPPAQNVVIDVPQFDRRQDALRRVAERTRRGR